MTGIPCGTGAGGGDRRGSRNESDMARSVDVRARDCSRFREADREGVTGVGGVSESDGDFWGLLSA